MEKILYNYELSVWRDVPSLKNTREAGFEEQKIMTIASSQTKINSDAFDIFLKEDINGEKTLTFKVLRKYFNEEGVLVSNPIVDSLINERKIKLRQGPEYNFINPQDFFTIDEEKRWTTFVLKNIEEDKESYINSYIAKEVFVNELGRNGWAVLLSTELENNYGTLPELAEKILKGSDWKVDSSSYSPVEKIVQPLFKAEVGNEEGVLAELIMTGEIVTIPPGQVIYPLYDSMVWEDENWVFSTEAPQFLWKNDYEFSKNDADDDNLIINEDLTYNYIALEPIRSNFTITMTGMLGGEPLQGNYIIKNTETIYEPYLDRFVQKYLVNNEEAGLPLNAEVFKYNKTEYITPEVVKNYLTNASNFVSSLAWHPELENNPQPTTLPYPSSERSQDWFENSSTNYLKLPLDNFNNFYNEGPANNRLTLIQDNVYVVRIKARLIRKNVIDYGTNGSNIYTGTQPKIYVSLGNYNSKTGIYNSKTNYKRISLKESEIDQSVDSKIRGYGKITEGPRVLYSRDYLLDEENDTYVDEQGYVYVYLTAEETTKASLDKLAIEIKNNTTSKNFDYYIEDVQLFDYIEFKTSKNSTQPIFLGDQSFFDGSTSFNNFSTQINFIPQYYYIDNENEIKYLSSNESFYTPKIIDNYAAVRNIEVKESNYFNNIMNLAELFESWVSFSITHQKDGKIWLQDGKPEKLVIFSQYSPNDSQNYVGFRYGTNLKNIKRSIDSNTLATKIIVRNNNQKYAIDGTASITRAVNNPSGENEIYNFNYYVNQGLIDNTQLQRDLYGLNYQDLGFYTRMKFLNKQYHNLSQALEEYITNLEIAKSYVIFYQAAIDSANATILYEEHLYNSAPGQDTDYHKQRKATILQTLAQRKAFYIFLNQYEDRVDSYKNNIEITKIRIKEILEEKQENKDIFYKKYSQYIQEATWTDQKYVDDNLYYLDATKVASTSAFPQISYQIETIDLSEHIDYKNYILSIGERTYIEDTEFFGWTYKEIKTDEFTDIVKTPYKMPVIVSERNFCLDNPDKTTLVIQNYKNQYKDLFQKIVAATNQLQYQSNKLDTIANQFTESGSLEVATLQEAFSNNAFILASASNQNVIWDAGRGIEITDNDNNSLAVRITAGGVFLTSDGGRSWINSITGLGINTNHLLAGEIDAGRINIIGGGLRYFRWDAEGLSAYRYENQQQDSSKYVRFNQYGLYGTAQGISLARSLNQKDNYIDKLASIQNYSNFSLTWKGLHLNSQDGALALTPERGLEIFNPNWVFSSDTLSTYPYTLDGAGKPYLITIEEDSSGALVERSAEIEYIVGTDLAPDEENFIWGKNYPNSEFNWFRIIFSYPTGAKITTLPALIEKQFVQPKRNLLIDEKINRRLKINEFSGEEENTEDIPFFTTDFIAVESLKKYTFSSYYHDIQELYILEYDNLKTFLQGDKVELFDKEHTLTTKENTKFVRLSFNYTTGSDFREKTTQFMRGAAVLDWQHPPESNHSVVIDIEDGVYYIYVEYDGDYFEVAQYPIINVTNMVTQNPVVPLVTLGRLYNEYSGSVQYGLRMRNQQGHITLQTDNEGNLSLLNLLTVGNRERRVESVKEVTERIFFTVEDNKIKFTLKNILNRGYIIHEFNTVYYYSEKDYLIVENLEGETFYHFTLNQNIFDNIELSLTIDENAEYLITYTTPGEEVYQFLAITGAVERPLSSDLNPLLMYAGHIDTSRAPFKLYSDGSFEATRATIMGRINATAGFFSGIINVGGTSGIDGSLYADYSFWSGKIGAIPKFYVTPTGKLVAQEAEIYGEGSFAGEIEATGILTGHINALSGNLEGPLYFRNTNSYIGYHHSKEEFININNKAFAVDYQGNIFGNSVALSKNTGWALKRNVEQNNPEYKPLTAKDEYNILFGEVSHGSYIMEIFNSNSELLNKKRVFGIQADGSVFIDGVLATNNDLIFKGSLKSVNERLIIDGNRGSISASSPYSDYDLNWQISEDGSAFFNNVRVRGEIESAVFNYGKVSAVGGKILITPSIYLTEDVEGFRIIKNGEERVVFNLENYLNQSWSGVDQVLVNFESEEINAELINSSIEINVIYLYLNTNNQYILPKGTQIISRSTNINSLELNAETANGGYILARGSSENPSVTLLGNLDSSLVSYSARNLFGEENLGYGLFADNAYLTGKLYLPNAGITNSAPSFFMEGERPKEVTLLTSIEYAAGTKHYPTDEWSTEPVGAKFNSHYTWTRIHFRDIEENEDTYTAPELIEKFPSTVNENLLGNTSFIKKLEEENIINNGAEIIENESADLNFLHIFNEDSILLKGYQQTISYTSIVNNLTLSFSLKSIVGSGTDILLKTYFYDSEDLLLNSITHDLSSFNLLNEWQNVVKNLSVPANTAKIRIEFGLENTGSFYLQALKLETGLIKTDWMPSPLDNRLITPVTTEKEVYTIVDYNYYQIETTHHSRIALNQGYLRGREIRFWAGTDPAHMTEAPFIVTHDGSLFAKQGRFSGEVIARNSEFSGTIRTAGVIIDESGPKNHFYITTPYVDEPTPETYILDIGLEGLKIWEGGLQIFSDFYGGWRNENLDYNGILHPYGYSKNNLNPWPIFKVLDASYRTYFQPRISTVHTHVWFREDKDNIVYGNSTKILPAAIEFLNSEQAYLTELDDYSRFESLLWEKETSLSIGRINIDNLNFYGIQGEEIVIGNKNAQAIVIQPKKFVDEDKEKNQSQTKILGSLLIEEKISISQEGDGIIFTYIGIE